MLIWMAVLVKWFLAPFALIIWPIMFVLRFTVKSVDESGKLPTHTDLSKHLCKYVLMSFQIQHWFSILFPGFDSNILGCKLSVLQLRWQIYFQGMTPYHLDSMCAIDPYFCPEWDCHLYLIKDEHMCEYAEAWSVANILNDIAANRNKWDYLNRRCIEKNLSYQWCLW